MRGWRTGTTGFYFGAVKFRPQTADNAEAMVSTRPLLVRDVMTAAPTVLHVTHSLGAAQHLFDEEGVQALPVIRGRKVVGSLSARDVADLLAREPDALDRRIAFAMGEAARVVRDDAPVAEAARLLADEGIHSLPVVDADGNLLGLMTSTELLRVLARLLDPN